MVYFIFFFILGLICEFIDSHLGGGYGTIISPMVLMMGYSPLEIIPAIMLSEIITGLAGGMIYNISKQVVTKSSLILFGTASIGAIAGTALLISIDKFYISLYIALLVLGLGFLMIRGFKIRKSSTKHVGALGSLIGFNKALSGGGFGPIAVAGLSVLGLDSKKAIGTTLLAEGLTCITALGLLFLNNPNYSFNSLVVPLVIGSLIGCVIGSKRTIKYDCNRLQRLVSVFIFLLGMSLLIKLSL